MRNDKVWQLIANELATHNAIQCKNKWKYLKSKYYEKKGNMSAKASGTKVMKFDYLEEFDDLFKDNANVIHVAIASSSNGIKNIKEIGSLTSTENQKKRKKSIL
ncbi:unnamed protein product [Psylliodes chrysocephalus]|uniref:HTH myb-type domain-containing protein n=1 Tax=Psylliodes chrysocephalus TaxID=3402493 RepID=A0A9P0DA82_9CUCU|nr:unnamed protein product [Psylliodes chrysocephala]